MKIVSKHIAKPSQERKVKKKVNESSFAKIIMQAKQHGGSLGNAAYLRSLMA